MPLEGPRLPHAHVIMPYHVALDRRHGGAARGAKIGATSRGIGPATRTGLADRAPDRGPSRPDVAPERVGGSCRKEPILLAAMGLGRSTSRPSWNGRLDWGRRLDGYLDDDLARPGRPRAGEHVLLEGAQGTLLDLDHGTYPYVASRSRGRRCLHQAAVLGPLQWDEVIGVMKPYATRVGSGPFPTELHDEVAPESWPEVTRSATTGRPRRVGWFDAMPLRYAVAVNSISSIMLNQLDILAGIPPSAWAWPTTSAAGVSITGRRAPRRSPARPRSTRTSRAGTRPSTTSVRWPTCPRCPPVRDGPQAGRIPRSSS